MSSDKDVNKNTKDFGICLVEKKTSATSELEGDNKTL